MKNSTPGPWVTVRNNYAKLGDRYARVVWSESDPETGSGRGMDIAYVLPFDDDNGNANARLIAAAPRMADACIGMADRLDEYCEELKRDGMPEWVNVQRIANTLRAAVPSELSSNG